MFLDTAAAAPVATDTAASATRNAVPYHVPRLGFLGVGWIGRNRLAAVARSGLADVVAMADPSAGCLTEALMLVPHAAAATDLDALLAQPVDGIVVATPSAQHAAQSIRTLQAGKAVFCQKPLGRNAAEVAEVVAAAQAADRLLGVDLSYRHTCFRRVYDLVTAGAIGEVHAVELVFHNAYGPDKPWFYDAGQSGGGCVIDLGVHLVDLALWTLHFPDIRSVHSHLLHQGQVLPPRALGCAATACEDYATALIATEGGTSIQLTCSWNLPAGQEADIQVRMYGSQGGVVFRNLNGSFYDFGAYRTHGTTTETLFEGKDDWGGRAAVAWTDHLRRNPAYDAQTGAELVRVAQVLDRIYHNC